MTPYYYRTRPVDKERLANLDTLQTDIDFIIAATANNLPNRDRFILLGFIWANVKGRPRRCAIGPF